ncbi:MAG: hypothetical protein EOP19_05275 [Hyphomicrobiales bacterium]|nr:MAG: hypothetical protein EOP19_05275 [Hyphomicrobiales bacterium]
MRRPYDHAIALDDSQPGIAVLSERYKLHQRTPPGKCDFHCIAPFAFHRLSHNMRFVTSPSLSRVDRRDGTNADCRTSAPGIWAREFRKSWPLQHIEGNNRMNSLDKTLSILSLFADETSTITHEQVEDLTKSSRSSAYRYLQSLIDVGLLAQTASGSYGLGARILELDRLQRRSDSLLAAARPIMAETAERLGHNLILSRYYGNRVVVSHTEWPDQSMDPVFERGKPLPLFYGAMAKVILANLTSYQMRSLMLRHVDEIRRAGLGDDWKQFRASMTRLRKQRVCVTLGEIITHTVGVAAPLVDGEERVLGSVAFTVPRDVFDAAGDGVLSAEIIGVSTRIMDKLDDGKSAEAGGSRDDELQD